MAGQLSQSNRVAEFSTPLGKDALVLIKFEGSEGLGELFDYQIEALSEQENIDFDKALGRGCTLKLKAYDGKERIYNGILIQAQWIGMMEELHRYRLVLRPWLWLLGHKANCRIFLDQKLPDILKKVLEGDVAFRLNGDYEKIAYCVQYRETDLAFVSRLMEQYGIYYFFEHSDGKHTLVLADSRSSHNAIRDLPKVPYIALAKTELRPEQHLYDWVSERRFRTGKIQFNDYDYLKPKKNLLAPSEASEKYANSKLEVYDYPGKYDDEDKGKNLSRFRLEAEQASDHRRLTHGDAASLYPGGLVTVEKHPTSAENAEYLVVHSTHRFSSHHYRSAAAPDKNAAADTSAAPDMTVPAEKDQVYYGDYELQPSDRPFRMVPVTPKPRIQGIQTAKVVGKKGEEKEEISTDEHGRIWVQFFWDREPKLTCPIRVAQVWASKQWGGQFIPRIDMEVVIEFLEGDPDRPLVTGCVFNGDNKYPYKLPENKTQSGLKSDSSKGHSGYNELMFEDKKGSEEVRFHAQKNLDSVIENNETRKVGNDQTLTVANNQTETILNNRSVTVVSNDSLTVEMNQTTTAGLTITHTVGMTTTTLTPASKTDESPTINHTAEMAVNVTAGVSITLTAPIINLNGMVLINGMVPMMSPF